MKPKDPPPAVYAFGYRRPPRSGNAINGLGVGEKVRPSIVFHNPFGAPPIEWQALDSFQKMVTDWGFLSQRLRNLWQLRRAEGPVARRRIAVTDPSAMSDSIKSEARRLGVGTVGISAVEPTDVYEGKPIRHRFAICIGMPMDRAEMLHVPAARAGHEVMRTYRRVGRVAVRLAERIRAMGWPARAYGNPNSSEILLIPLAIRAGLGQLGKHGSMICTEYGSNFRLSAVLTDLPLALDRPIDIGVDDLCLSCQRCVADCPPAAIFDRKQMVRGEEKWYVDFDKCVPYFTKTYGCAICLEVCPWSEPGRGPALAEKLLAKRARAVEPVA